MALMKNGKIIVRPLPVDTSADEVGEGTVIGKRAFDFNLPDQEGEFVRLSETIPKGPVLLAFYPVDFGLVCTKQLCNYRDSFESFRNLGIQVLGISSNSVAEHSKFIKRCDFPFPLLTDSNQRVAREYNCTSFWMMGKISRAVYIINTTGLILYRYVEPTILTHQNAQKLLMVLNDLRLHKFI